MSKVRRNVQCGPSKSRYELTGSLGLFLLFLTKLSPWLSLPRTCVWGGLRLMRGSMALPSSWESGGPFDALSFNGNLLQVEARPGTSIECFYNPIFNWPCLPSPAHIHRALHCEESSTITTVACGRAVCGFKKCGTRTMFKGAESADDDDDG